MDMARLCFEKSGKVTKKTWNGVYFLCGIKEFKEFKEFKEIKG